jgi:hypothetical protein
MEDVELRVRFTPSERDMILRIARARDCSPSDMVRELMRLLPLRDQLACERRERRMVCRRERHLEVVR